MSINPLQFTPNSYQISELGKDQGKQAEAKKEEKATNNADAKIVSADDTLSFMENQSVGIANVDRTCDVSKYVTSEEAQRIGAFMGQFEDVVCEGLKVLDNTPLSDDAKMTLSSIAADRLYTEKFRNK